MTRLHLTERDRNRTVLEILRQRIPAAPPAYLRQLLRRGKISCAGHVLDENDRMQGNEILLLPDSARLRELRDSQLPEIDILLETASLLAVYKPAGLAVHRGMGHEKDNLTARVQQLMTRRRAPFGVAPVHRLDVGTSGPLLFGKGRQASAALGRMIMAGQLRKTYLALVRGRPPATGLLTMPVNAKGKWKDAATSFCVRAQSRDSALLEMELLSGRMHQIRQQCAASGWPLYGDGRYGGPPLPHMDRLFLHCRQLLWPLGETNPQHRINCPLPRELRAVLTMLGINDQAAETAS
jgi:23S rRNA-/tRNA-specific pseudouridylate synthase